MRVLVVTATENETAPLVAKLKPMSGRESEPRLRSYTLDGSEVDVLVTGVGMVPTAAWCSSTMAGNRYGIALNLGVCGSFERALPPGTVVHVVRDRIAELGAEDGERFVTIEELGLAGENEFPFVAGQLVNERPPANDALASLPAVQGITVNTVHGNKTSIDAVAQRFNPQVESMEGAAFMYACLVNGVPFAQVRAVSNVVERRNRESWKLNEAIERLATAALRILQNA